MKKQYLWIMTICMLLFFAGLMQTGQTIYAEEAVSESYTESGVVYEYVILDDGTVSITGCDLGNVTDVTIPETISGRSVTSIGDEAFLECKTLTSVDIPESVTEIGERAFRDCSKLTSIEIPSGVTEIKYQTFLGCKLETVILPENLISIGEQSFSYCNLKNFTIPSKVKTIGKFAFSWTAIDYGITVVPESVTKIDKSAFHQCYGTVVILNKDCEIGDVDSTLKPTIYGFRGSTAETYANKYGKTFKVYGEDHIYEIVSLTASTCVHAGEHIYKCAICGDTYTQILDKKSHCYGDEAVTKATTSKNGSIKKTCTVCGEVESTTIYKPSKIVLSKNTYTYNGKVKKPSVTVKDSKGNDIASSNYTVTYTKNKSVGQAIVKVTFKENYKGTMTKNFTITPVATKINTLSAKSKGFTVKWKVQTKETTGYEIQYSTSKSFKKSNTVTKTVNKNKKSSGHITKLKANKKYYVRIRTYKVTKINGKSTKIYSDWSETKIVKTKK